MKLFIPLELREAYRELAIINKLEPELKALSDEALKAKTVEFKTRFSQGETLKSLRPEVFAVVREAARRVLGQRLFDVQIVGGIILTKGSVAEMKTGEGKTITSIAPVFLNALTGRGALIVTVNEYLAQRDAEDMGEVHKFLGLTVGVNLVKLSTEQKRAAYACDVTYSVHAEVGFDYLRDNMVNDLSEKVQRGFNYALIDEVDSILIDESRTPLIISGGSTIPMQAYVQADLFVKSLVNEDYEIDWESKGINLTQTGMDKANQTFNVKNFFDVENSEAVHRVSNALRANYVMARDVDYIVRDNKIDIVDAFTGRIMEGRSFSEGLHQAIQAKEQVKITPETAILATITYQNLFRMFKELAGMSGTAKTEEDEFIEIYNMRVYQIATNKPVRRRDHPDLVFASTAAKYKGIVSLVSDLYKKGQPVLVGTEEVVESERLSAMLTAEGIRHTVLNAKQNADEAAIIANAGVFKAVTIATNMAGRGTDIKPSQEALGVGGLFVVGTNKAEARRIDNQLRGRAGRQGDVGESQFLISLDDKLITRFANQEKLKKNFASFGDTPIPLKQIGRALNSAQVRIEGFNFDARKNVLQYDDVIRQQRDLIYAQRDIIITQDDLGPVIKRIMRSVVKDLVTMNKFTTFRRADHTIDPAKMAEVLNNLWFINGDYRLETAMLEHKTSEELVEFITKEAIEVYDVMRQNMIDNITEDGLHQSERSVILVTFDRNWQLHIDKMARLKSSTNLSSYAQKNPFQVYVEKGAALFQDLLQRIAHNTVRQLFSAPAGRKRIIREEQVIRELVQNAIASNDQSAEAKTSASALPNNIEHNLPTELTPSAATIKAEEKLAPKLSELDLEVTTAQEAESKPASEE